MTSTFRPAFVNNNNASQQEGVSPPSIKKKSWDKIVCETTIHWKGLVWCIHQNGEPKSAKWQRVPLPCQRKALHPGKEWARKQHPISVAETWCLFIKKNIKIIEIKTATVQFVPHHHQFLPHHDIMSAKAGASSRTTFGMTNHHTCCHRPPRANALMAAFKITRPEIQGRKNDGRTSWKKNDKFT